MSTQEAHHEHVPEQVADHGLMLFSPQFRASARLLSMAARIRGWTANNELTAQQLLRL